ncbi:hypothetical protein GGI25_003011 [Coemansia spiralis]|uniref:Cytidyltransferase-like domain-containing protein n=2 Tax=Coemansia TaxID=4863 RepID=A0A9W8G6T6_9FUNG|nr:hypothetical protein EDC05_002991 [Coemansia umbellata]KAJ2622017.1 hypothetical protein GGI26_003593 [Coemansia sp. RSA 1358]KAJ2677621.1 hypothetical protein GGI25_003011 [Coemansia spiralis]
MEASQKHNLFLRLDLGLPLPQDDINLVRAAVDCTAEELTIFAALENIDSVDRASGWSQMQRRVAELYMVAFGRALRIQSFTNIDIVLLDFCAYSVEDMTPFKQYTTLVSAKDEAVVPCWWPAEMIQNLVVYPEQARSPAPSTNRAANSSELRTSTAQFTRLLLPWESYAHVAVGGTFDHLHIGHKILLTATALAATKRVICGISVDALLERKKYKEQIEPYRVRELSVLLFLRKIRKDIIFELDPLYDLYGPTATDASIGALVVSQETLSGSSSLNERRAERGMPPMQLLPIDLVATPQQTTESADDDYSTSVFSENTALKISSTAIRASLAEKQQRG